MHRNLQKLVDHDVSMHPFRKRLESVPHKIFRLDTCVNVIVGGDRDSTTVIRDYVSVPSENCKYIGTAKPKSVGLGFPITILLEPRKIPIEGMIHYIFSRRKGPLKTSCIGIKYVRTNLED